MLVKSWINRSQRSLVLLPLLLTASGFAQTPNTFTNGGGGASDPSDPSANQTSRTS